MKDLKTTSSLGIAQFQKGRFVLRLETGGDRYNGAVFASVRSDPMLVGRPKKIYDKFDRKPVLTKKLMSEMLTIVNEMSFNEETQTLSFS
jgi:hypothetical protein